MDPEDAEYLMSASLAYCSRLAKILTAVQDDLGHGDRTKPYSDTVGHILSWFYFEVFGPLGRAFPELEEWPLRDQDWAQGFVLESDKRSRYSHVEQIAEDGDGIADRLVQAGVVNETALAEFRALTSTCRQCGREFAAGTRVV